MDQPIRARSSGVSCALEGAEIADRLERWKRVRARASAVAIPGGVRLRFTGRSALEFEEIERLVRDESACCGFLRFELATDGRHPCLDVTAPDAAATAVIFAITGFDPAGVRARGRLSEDRRHDHTGGE